MNHIFSSIWNHSLGAWVAASEHTRRGRQRGGSASRSRDRKASAPQMAIGALQVAVLLACGWLLTAGTQATAQSLPQNGNIVSGSASININGNVMTIDQTSRAALINWSSFDIGAANTVQFNQLQGSQATAVNLVTGGSASLISGQLTSIGQVFLINPAGITFTSGARVNVGGLLASTLSPGTPGLLDANGVSPTFQLAGGGTGAVVSNNGGTLSAAAGGISLIGGAVSNTGIISAANGSINLVAAGAAMVTNGVSSSGMSQLLFLPTSVGTFAGTGINNAGVLNARSISMNALMGPGLSSTGINAGGTITANAIDAGDGSLTIRSSAPVALSNATITAGSVAVAGAGIGGPVAIQMTDGSIRASTVAFDGGPSGNVMLGGGVKADTIHIAANNALQTGGTLEGALSLATPGQATLGQSGNRIGSVGGSVGSDLTLTTSTDLSNGGALLVGGSTVLEAGASNITLTNSGNSFGNGVSAHGGDITLASGGALGLGNINARSLAVQAGSIDLGGTVITTGDQNYQSSVTLRGNSALQGSAIQFNGTVDGSYQLAVDSSGMTTFSSAVGGSTALQGLRVTSGTGTRLFGDITTMGTLAFDGAVRVSGARSLSSLGGSLRFGGTLDGDGGTLNLSARQLTLGGAVGGAGPVGRLYGHADSITLGSRIASTGAILLEGDVRLDGNTQLVSTGGGAITTDGISSNITNGYNLLMSTTGQVQVNGNISAADVSITGQLFNGRGIASKGNLDIDSALTLVQMGNYQVDGWARFRSLGDINLADAGNRFSGEVSLSGKSATLRAADLQLGNTLLSDNLQLDLSGFLQQVAGSVVDIGGTTRIDAGGFVSLDRLDGMGRPVNRFGGAMSLKGGNSNIYANGTLAFSDFDVGSVWAIADTVRLPASGRSIGLQYFQGDAELGGDSVLDSQLGQINFRGRIDGAHALTLTSGLEVVFAGDVGSRQALASLGINGAGPLQLGGNITTSGAIQLGNVNLAASTPRWFSIRSNNGNVRVGRVDGSSDGLSSLALDAHGTLELQSDAGTLPGAWLTDLELNGASVTTKAIRTTGRLDVTSSSGFTQGGAFTIGGDASFSASPTGNLVLDAYPNTFGGKVALTGAAARIQALSGLALDGIDTTTLDAYSVGAMSLAHANIANTASLSGAALLFDGASIGGLLQATARTGDIRQGSAALTLGNNSELRASTDIVLGNTGNQLGNALQAQGRDVTLTSSAALDLQNLQAMRDAQLSGNGVRLGTTSVLGTLQVDSTAAIHQGGTLEVAGDSRFTAGGDIALDNAGNHFGGSVALAGSNVAIASDHAGLALAEVHAATLEAGSLGALSLANATVAGTTQLQGSSVALGRTDVGGAFTATATSTDITQTDRLSVGGNSQLQAANAITLDRAQNHFGGRVDLHAASAKLGTDGSLALGDVTADRLQASATQGLQLQGHIAATTVDLATAGAFDNQTGADAIRVGGNGRWHVYLDAPDQGHQFGGLDSGNTAVWNTQALGATSAAGNRYLFAWSPTLTVEGMALSKNLGTVLDISQAYTWSGLMPGVANAYRADSLAGVLGGNIRVTSAGAAGDAAVQSTPYRIDLDASHLDLSQSGYQLVLRPGELQITSTQDSAAYQSAIRLPATAVAEQPLPPTASYVARTAGGMQRPTSRCTALTTDCVEE